MFYYRYLMPCAMPFVIRFTRDTTPMTLISLLVDIAASDDTPPLFCRLQYTFARHAATCSLLMPMMPRAAAFAADVVCHAHYGLLRHDA